MKKGKKAIIIASSKTKLLFLQCNNLLSSLIRMVDTPSVGVALADLIESTNLAVVNTYFHFVIMNFEHKKAVNKKTPKTSHLGRTEQVDAQLICLNMIVSNLVEILRYAKRAQNGECVELPIFKKVVFVEGKRTQTKHKPGLKRKHRF